MQKTKRLMRRRSHGFAIVYTVIIWIALWGICSLAIDYARAQMVKTQLLRSADAAARYGSLGIVDGTYATKAIAAAGYNQVDGSSCVLLTSDVVRGTWNSGTHTFTATNTSPTAIQVTATRCKSRGTAVPTIFATMLGCTSIDVTETCVATCIPAVNTTINVPGTADPWLAGAASGTTANYTNQGWTDSTTNCSPTQATGITITPGQPIQFAYTGSVSYYPGTQPFDPDGDTGWLIDNYYATGNGNIEHGMSNLIAPLTCVVGVFLDASTPTGNSGPAMLNFSSPSSRDFASLSPLLNQTFFIGNGVRADGTTLQNFYPPTGATRLFIGVMDGQQWSDNSGSLSTTVTKPAVISTVK